MNNSSLTVSSVFVALQILFAGGCSDSSVNGQADASPASDATVPEDASVSVPDAGAKDAAPDTSVQDAAPIVGDYMSLNGMTTAPTLKQCPGNIIVGSAPNKTSFQFTFKSPPQPGTYTIEPAANIGTPPGADTGVVMGYGQQIQGGADEKHIGQSGTVTVTMAGGKLQASATGVPSVEKNSQAKGTVASTLTCP